MQSLPAPAALGADLLRHLEVARQELTWTVEQFPESLALWSPGDGAWSAHQTLAHLRDTEVHAYAVRVSRILAEETPELPDFPGGQWVATWTPTGPLVATLDAYLATSRASSERLSAIDAAAWERVGAHPHFGRLTLLGWLERMHFHLIDHLGQILAVRAQLRTRGLLP
ncbi:MAG: DinB family protein [Chloroflexi bacterium]|nr:DinB family protein [Chloroflexota bacterium]